MCSTTRGTLRQCASSGFGFLRSVSGGYGDPNAGGNSLRMWKAYFPYSRIYGLDLYDKRQCEESRIRIFQADQGSVAALRRVAAAIGTLDIVLDDGSHENRHTIDSFQTFFPRLRDGGIYAVEDTSHSYWPGFGGSRHRFDDPKTTMGYFKRLLDGLNFAEFVRPGYWPTYFDQRIVAMHFYHNLIVIVKGENNEGSLYLKDNTTDADWIMQDYTRASGYGRRGDGVPTRALRRTKRYYVRLR